MPPVIPDPAHKLTPEQQYEFDLNGYIVLKDHYDADALALLHEGIDELQAIPLDYDTYRNLGIASYHLAAAMEDPQHVFWNRNGSVNPETGRVRSVDQAICGTDRFDGIVRDPVLEDIHSALAGSTIFISATYFIERVGTTAVSGLHNGGHPPDRHIYYDYDHANGRFNCACPLDMSDAANNPMAVAVFASPGDVIIFTEGMTHNAYSVTSDTVRRSVFFCYMPSINRNNLPQQRMSMYPDHVLDRLSDKAHLLTAPGYI
jgi:hypothetical protein